MTAIQLTRLSDTVGAEVSGLDRDRMVGDDELPHLLMDALEAHGALVLRGLHLDPEAQVAFCRKIADIDVIPGSHPVPGIYRVTLDPARNRAAEYLKGTFDWHIDGATPTRDEYPQMATVLTAVAVAEEGGETEFASTYAAYDDLSAEEKERFASVRVVHSMEASQRRVCPDPTPEQLAGWRARPSREHPLVWTHKTGRRSLVLGTSCDYVVGMDLEEGRALLADLVTRATRPERVYRHEWSVGDTVIWDNRGVLHRAAPYDQASPREMLRTTILGDEPIQ